MDTAARRGIWWPGRSTLSATCTVAGTVQESLWKLREKYYRGTFLSAQLEESSPRLFAFTVQPGQDKEGTVKMVKSLKQSGRATCVLSASDSASMDSCEASNITNGGLRNSVIERRFPIQLEEASNPSQA